MTERCPGTGVGEMWASGTVDGMSPWMSPVFGPTNRCTQRGARFWGYKAWFPSMW